MAEASIQVKYERLAQEYAKLRSNTTVLKKAVIEEKASKTKLAEELKTAEMSQRKTSQELEALQFRNQQLAKRIEVLQDDLDAAQVAVNKKRGQNTAKIRNAGASSGPEIDMPDQALVMEQLQKTIEENARLSSELSETRESFEVKLRQLRDSNNSSTENAQRELQQGAEQRAKIQAECVVLRDEKRALENQLIAKEAAQQQLSLTIDDLQKKLAALQHRYDQFKLSVAASAPVPTPVPAPETNAEKAVQPPVPTEGPLPTPQALVPCMQVALGFALRFLRGMKEWHENHARRLRLPFGPLRSDPQLLEALSKCSEAAALLEEAVARTESAMKETAPKFSEEQIATLFEAIKRYGDVLTESLSPLCQRIEDECALSFCSASLVERNKEIVSALSDLSSTLSQIIPVATQNAAVPNGEQTTAILWCCRELLQACKQLARLLNRKVSLEQSLPDLSEEVKAANEAMVHGLLVARTALEKLHGHLTGHAAFFSPAGWAVAREVLGARAAVSNGPLRSASPQLVLSASQASLASSDEVQRLQREVGFLREQVRSLEQARDSAGLEAQLERMRRGRENQRRCEVEKELLSIRSCSPSSLPEDTPGSCGEEPTSERELLIQRYYQEIVSKQQQELYLLTGIAENFKAESENARAQWMLLEKRNVRLESDVSGLQLSSKSISEDLESTRRNYETQLSTLTEHIADMNEKLIHRQECIEALKQQLESKQSPPSSRSASFSAVANFLVNTAKRK